jgi:hypothetical protein
MTDMLVILAILALTTSCELDCVDLARIEARVWAISIQALPSWQPSSQSEDVQDRARIPEIITEAETARVLKHRRSRLFSRICGLTNECLDACELLYHQHAQIARDAGCGRSDCRGRFDPGCWRSTLTATSAVTVDPEIRGCCPSVMNMWSAFPSAASTPTRARCTLFAPILADRPCLVDRAGSDRGSCHLPEHSGKSWHCGSFFAKRRGRGQPCAVASIGG